MCIKNFTIKRKILSFFLASFMLCLGIVLLSACSRSKTGISKTGFYFDTLVTITLNDSSNEELLNECFALCEAYEKKLSKTLEDSEIWNINHAGGRATTVSEETATLIKTALVYCEITKGKLDCTIAPIAGLWDFTAENGQNIPSENDILARLPLVNYKAVAVNNNTVTLLNENSSLDLGFIAKGYIADKLKAFLVSNNVESAIINLGGNVLTIGNKPDGSPFNIGIQKPFDETNTAITSVAASDSSVVSSGVYERYFEKDGKIYHHILDPKTGYPYDNNLLEVTILSKTSSTGDALSTACFVLGLDDGMKLIESLPGVEAVFITDDYELHYTSGIAP